MADSSGKGMAVVASVILAVFLFGGAAYLIFYLPVQAEMMKDFGRPLSGGMQVLLNLSNFLKHYGLFVMPVFIFIAWLPFYFSSNKQE